jgi:hypothetical protein
MQSKCVFNYLGVFLELSKNSFGSSLSLMICFVLTLDIIFHKHRMRETKSSLKPYAISWKFKFSNNGRR